MKDSLYFDAARLGQITPKAQKALCELLRYSRDHGSTNSFEPLLIGGFQSWPHDLQDCYPALSSWTGLSELKKRLRDVVGARPRSKVILANRSSQLMRFASLLFFGPCKNVLVTDCNWPSYERILQQTRGHAGRQVTKLRLRNALLRGALSKQELVDRMVQCYVKQHCDGIFLPAVDNLGVVFPVKEIVQAVSAQAEIRFVAVDGAQAFCQTPVRLAQDYCDFFFTGCHKWLGAYLPMGVGFYGHRRSAGYIERRLEQAVELDLIDDPLLSLSEQLLAGKTSDYGETVNLTPLFTCSGALADNKKNSSEIRGKNLDDCTTAVSLEHYRVLNPVQQMQASVLLIQAKSRFARGGSELRTSLAAHGLVASCYENGMIRLAMPSQTLGEDAIRRLERALVSAASSRKEQLVPNHD